MNNKSRHARSLGINSSDAHTSEWIKEHHFYASEHNTFELQNIRGDFSNHIITSLSYGSPEVELFYFIH